MLERLPLDEGDNSRDYNDDHDNDDHYDDFVVSSEKCHHAIIQTKNVSFSRIVNR